MTGQASNSFQVSLPFRNPFFKLQQENSLKPVITFLRRLAVHTNVDAGFLRLQYFDRNLRHPLRWIESSRAVYP